MDQGRADGRVADSGLTTVGFVLAAALAMFMFVAMANLIAVQYGRGAVRSALEQGVAAGSVNGDIGACAAIADDVIGRLLGGRMGEGIALTCEPVGPRVRASAVGVFESWTFLAPDFEIRMTAEAVVEDVP